MVAQIAVAPSRVPRWRAHHAIWVFCALRWPPLNVLIRERVAASSEKRNHVTNPCSFITLIQTSRQYQST